LNFERTDPFSIEAWVKTLDTDGQIVVRMGGGLLIPVISS